MPSNNASNNQDNNYVNNANKDNDVDTTSNDNKNDGSNDSKTNANSNTNNNKKTDTPTTNQNNNTNNNNNSTTNNNNQNNNNENNMPPTTPEKSAKDKLIDVLLNMGYRDFAGDKIMYYYEGDELVTTDGVCTGAWIVHFNNKKYEYHFSCNDNGNTMYERTVTYHWDTNRATVNEAMYEYPSGIKKTVRAVNATLDASENFYCTINECQDYKNEIYDFKNNFSNMLSKASINRNELN